MHVLSLKVKCKQYSSRRTVIIVRGSGTVNDVCRENIYCRREFIDDCLSSRKQNFTV